MNTTVEVGNVVGTGTPEVDELGLFCAWCGQCVPNPCSDDQYERCDNYRHYPPDDERRH